jgi:hypothetical protein
MGTAGAERWGGLLKWWNILFLHTLSTRPVIEYKYKICREKVRAKA